MNKYKLEDLEVGAVFEESGHTTRTIIAVGKIEVLYSYHSTCGYVEKICPIGEFLRGDRGELVRPTMKIAYVEYWSCRDLSSKRYCSKEVWNRGASTNSTLKFIREFEIEVGEDGFPIEGGV